MTLLADLLGVEDARKCITEGDIMACLWTVVGFTPWGKGAKLLKRAPKILRLWNRWRSASRTLDRATERYDEVLGTTTDALSSCTGNRPRPGNSFVAGTPVALAGGGRAPIEEIAPGDRVLATDPATGVVAARTVLDTVTGSGRRDLVDVTVHRPGGGTVLTATAEHRFWNDTADRWTPAADLSPGDRLRGADGGPATVFAVGPHTGARTTVYNLSVEDVHTYHVGAGAAAVLVHNDGPDLDDLLREFDENENNRRNPSLDDLLAGADTAGGVCRNPASSDSLRNLHPPESLVQSSLEGIRRQSTDDIIASLRPGAAEPLRVRPDGTIMDGNHRITVLRERGVDIDSLPRETYRSELPDDGFWE